MTRLIRRQDIGVLCPDCGRGLFQREQESGEGGLLQGKWLRLGPISCSNGHKFEKTADGLKPLP
jgi:hypothetical protein